MTETKDPIDLQVPGEPVIRYGTQAGILIGLLIGGMILAQVIALFILLPFLDMKSIDFSNLINYQDPSIGNALKVSQFVATILTFILPAWFFSLITRQPLLRLTGLKVSPGIGSSLLVPFLVIASLPIIAWTAELNKLLPLPEFLLDLEKDAEELTKLFLKSEGPGDLFINLVVVAVAAAVAEEVFFRGCLQKVFLGWIKNTHAAIWITAIIFSALHFQFHGFLPRMLLGGVLGYLFAWTGSLWIPILAHFINNGLAVFLNYLVQKEVLSPAVENYGSSESDWMGILAGTLLMTGILLLIRKINVVAPNPDAT